MIQKNDNFQKVSMKDVGYLRGKEEILKYYLKQPNQPFTQDKVPLTNTWSTAVSTARDATKQIKNLTNFILTFESLAVSLRTTRFNIKKFYTVLAPC